MAVKVSLGMPSHDGGAQPAQAWGMAEYKSSS
jgi:hypothetical protein